MLENDNAIVAAAVVSGGVAVALSVFNAVTSRRVARELEDFKRRELERLETHKQRLAIAAADYQRNRDAIVEAYSAVQRLRDEMYRLVSPRCEYASSAEANERLSAALLAVQTTYAQRAIDLWPQRASLHAAKRFSMDVSADLLRMTQNIDRRIPPSDAEIRRVLDARELLSGIQALLCAATAEEPPESTAL